MLEQGKQGDRREAAIYCSQQGTQQRGRRRIDQRLTGGIIYLDVPAPQLGRHPSCQIAIGRDQRSGAAPVLQRLAQGQRDYYCFLVRSRAVARVT